jgi:hypothetical protein
VFDTWKRKALSPDGGDVQQCSTDETTAADGFMVQPWCISSFFSDMFQFIITITRADIACVHTLIGLGCAMLVVCSFSRVSSYAGLVGDSNRSATTS